MRNGKEGVSYRLVLLSGNTAVKSVNFVDGSASDSTPFTTDGYYTVALVAGAVVLEQYANVRVGNPPAQTYTLTGSIRNNPGSSAIIFTVDGNVVTSGSQVAEGKTVHVEITNATENWQAFTVNNQTKVTTASGTSRVVDFVMPSADAACVATFEAVGGFSNVTVGGAAFNADKEVYSDEQLTIAGTYNGSGANKYGLVKGTNKPTVGSTVLLAVESNSNNFTLTQSALYTGEVYWLVAANGTTVVETYDYKVTVQSAE